MAIEDAAVLGNLLSRLSHKSQLKPLLEAYQTLRHDRTADAQAQSRLNQLIFHMPDGPEQRARDDNMRRAMQGHKDVADGGPNQWADKKKSNTLFGYDADKEVEKWWAETGAKDIGTRDGSRL